MGTYTGIYFGRVIPLTFLFLGVVSVLTGSFWWTFLLLVLATVGGVLSSELSNQEEKILAGGVNFGGGELYKVREYISNTFEKLSTGANAGRVIGGIIVVVIQILIIASAGMLAVVSAGMFAHCVVAFGFVKISKNRSYLQSIIKKNCSKGFN